MSSSDSPEGASAEPEIAELGDRLRSGHASEDDIDAAFQIIDAPEYAEEDVGGLINAVSEAGLRALLPRLVGSLRSTQSPNRAILLIRAIRRAGAVDKMLPDLLRLSRGVAWDPEGQAWLAALGTLAHHAQQASDRRLVEEIRRVAGRDDLTADQISWARKCLKRASGEN